MNYIGEDDKQVSASDDACVEERILEFNHDSLDFFLKHKIVWDEIDGSVYEVKIGDGMFTIPSGIYVMIGDDYGDFDWIEIDEMFGRPHLTVTTFDTDFRQWSVSDMVVKSTFNTIQYWPSTKQIIPIISNGVVILVAEKDQHLKMQDHQVEVFTHLTED